MKYAVGASLDARVLCSLIRGRGGKPLASVREGYVTGILRWSIRWQVKQSLTLGVGDMLPFTGRPNPPSRTGHPSSPKSRFWYVRPTTTSVENVNAPRSVASVDRH